MQRDSERCQLCRNCRSFPFYCTSLLAIIQPLDAYLPANFDTWMHVTGTCLRSPVLQVSKDFLMDMAIVVPMNTAGGVFKMFHELVGYLDGFVDTPPG